jgi:hypothetical protein
MLLSHSQPGMIKQDDLVKHEGLSAELSLLG